MITPGGRADFEGTLKQCLMASGASQEEADEAVDAWRLGTFIYQQNPYGAGLKVSVPLALGAFEVDQPFATYLQANKPLEDAKQIVLVDGHAWDHDEKVAVRFKDIRDVPANTDPEKVALLDRIMDSLFWYFRGKPARVIKALAIPYRYKDQRPDGQDTFLYIGYHGQGCD